MADERDIKYGSSFLERKEPVHGNHRPEMKNVSWLPDGKEDGGNSGKDPMVPGGPWATGGGLSWSPDSGITGTRPVVDHYSTTRFSYKDWKDHNKSVLGISADDLHRVNMAEYNGRRGMECISLSADKIQYINSERTQERLHELVKWKTEVERALQDMTEEIAQLENDRRRLDSARCSLLLVKSISSECLSRRAMREGKDLSADKVEQELIKEAALVKEVSDLYIRTLHQIEEQLERDHSTKARLEADWSDKQDAWKILIENARLKTTSNTVMFKPAATRYTENQTSIEGWEKATKELVSTAEAVKKQSAELRSMIAVSILGGCASDLKAQADKVDIAFARRIAETDEVVKAMYKELEVIVCRNAEVERLVLDLQQGVRSLDVAMKVAQTRLENLHRRPRQENCRDIAQSGLVDEVKTLGEQVTLMRSQLQEAEDSFIDLIKSRGIIEKEIQIKLKTLYIDKERCQVMRAQYPSATAMTGH